MRFFNSKSMFFSEFLRSLLLVFASHHQQISGNLRIPQRCSTTNLSSEALFCWMRFFRRKKKETTTLKSQSQRHLENKKIHSKITPKSTQQQQPEAQSPTVQPICVSFPPFFFLPPKVERKLQGAMKKAKPVVTPTTKSNTKKAKIGSSASGYLGLQVGG